MKSTKRKSILKYLCTITLTLVFVCTTTLAANADDIVSGNPDIHFINLESTLPIVGEYCDLNLDDQGLDGYTYKFWSNTIVSVQIEERKKTSPGGGVRLLGKELGTYTIYAEIWDKNGNYVGETSYTGQVTTYKGTATITGDLGKEYDGNPIEDPEVDTNIDPPVTTYTYYEGDKAEGKPLTSKPTNAGTYTVKVEVQDKSTIDDPNIKNYTTAYATKSFEITQRAVGINLNWSKEKGNSAFYLEAEVSRMLKPLEGRVRFEIYDASGKLVGEGNPPPIAEAFSTTNENGNYVVKCWTMAKLPDGKYTIKAIYLPDEDDYSASNNYSRQEISEEIDTAPAVEPSPNTPSTDADKAPAANASGAAKTGVNTGDMLIEGLLLSASILSLALVGVVALIRKKSRARNR